MNRLNSLMLSISLLLLFAMHLRAQETPPAEAYSEIPATRINLRIPSGFMLADGFPGIVHEEYGAALVATEISSPLEKVLAGMTEQDFAAEGMTLLSSEKVAVSGRDATFIRTSQEGSDGAVRKWLVVFGDDKITVLLAASAPEIVETEVGKALEECLLSAQWDASKKLDPYDGLGFSLSDSQVFEIRGRRPGGVLLTRKEAPDQLSPAEPIIVVYPSESPAKAPLPLLAKQALTEGEQFVDFANYSERPLTVNGLNGYEIIADAKESTMSVPVRILLLAVRAGDKDMIIEAIVEPGSWDQYISEFHALAESLRMAPVRNVIP